MSRDDDAPKLRVVRAEPKPPRTPEAEAAARYRARKRGEVVPKRKRGPKPKTITVLREEIRDLKARISDLELHERLLQERLRRQLSTLTVEQAARELLDVLRRDDPGRDSPERQILLRDVAAEIDERHESWQE